jgi:hypothetical protein
VTTVGFAATVQYGKGSGVEVSFEEVRPDAPETLRQAQRWQAVKHRYVQEGLGDRCAAQAAWAHQNHGDNWGNIHPPCAACEPIVATFPAATPSPLWRRIPHPEVPVPTTPGDAAADNHGALGASNRSESKALASTGGNA